MATELRKIVEATASYMRFEQLCHRTELFSEMYLAHPIGQYLIARHGRCTRTEWRHPILSANAAGRGRRPSFDFAVVDENDAARPVLAIETKWVNSASDLAEQLIRDAIRLELVAWAYGATTYLILAGTRRRIESLLASPAVCAYVNRSNSRALLTVKYGDKSTLPLLGPPKFRAGLIERALRPFAERKTEIAASIPMKSCGLFPADVPKNQCCAVGWEVLTGSARRFVPK